MANRQVIGGLMKNTSFLLDYDDIAPADFESDVIKVCFVAIKNLFSAGALQLSVVEVDQEIEKWESRSTVIYRGSGGLEFLKCAYEIADINNFEMYYNRLKKMSLMRRLVREKYDVSEYYIDDKDIVDPRAALEIQDKFDNASIEDILNSVEKKYSIIRNDYLHGGRQHGNVAEGINDLIEDLRSMPNIGISLEGKIFSSLCRGARQGCFYLKSSSSGSGKTRTSVYDACRICYPERWSHELGTFIEEVDEDGCIRKPEKVVFIVTEMDKEEIQTIILSYLSGINEAHIITGAYNLGELNRVRYAAEIMKKFQDYFIVEEISDPNLTNVEATIKRYATVDHVKYVFYDYIHSTPSLISQFTKANIREDVCLMLLSNQLKQLAKDYSLFIMSATQVNATAMDEDGEFKNEMSIRASKSIVDKADIGYIMTRINQKIWNSMLPNFTNAAKAGMLNANYISDRNYRPTHILDIYKMRRGQFKNIRVWTQLDLGTGRRNDLFVTDSNNQPLDQPIDIFLSAREAPIRDWERMVL